MYLRTSVPTTSLALCFSCSVSFALPIWRTLWFCCVFFATDHREKSDPSLAIKDFRFFWFIAPMQSPIFARSLISWEAQSGSGGYKWTHFIFHHVLCNCNDQVAAQQLTNCFGWKKNGELFVFSVVFVLLNGCLFVIWTFSFLFLNTLSAVFLGPTFKVMVYRVDGHSWWLTLSGAFCPFHGPDHFQTPSWTWLKNKRKLLWLLFLKRGQQ